MTGIPSYSAVELSGLPNLHGCVKPFAVVRFHAWVDGWEVLSGGHNHLNRVNYPALLSNASRCFLEGGASCFCDATCIYNDGRILATVSRHSGRSLHRRFFGVNHS